MGQLLDGGGEDAGSLTLAAEVGRDGKTQVPLSAQGGECFPWKAALGVDLWGVAKSYILRDSSGGGGYSLLSLTELVEVHDPCDNPSLLLVLDVRAELVDSALQFFHPRFGRLLQLIPGIGSLVIQDG